MTERYIQMIPTWKVHSVAQGSECAIVFTCNKQMSHWAISRPSLQSHYFDLRTSGELGSETRSTDPGITLIITNRSPVTHNVRPMVPSRRTGTSESRDTTRIPFGEVQRFLRCASSSSNTSQNGYQNHNATLLLRLFFHLSSSVCRIRLQPRHLQEHYIVRVSRCGTTEERGLGGSIRVSSVNNFAE